jgi:hypothetical protein
LDGRAFELAGVFCVAVWCLNKYVLMYVCIREETTNGWNLREQNSAPEFVIYCSGVGSAFLEWKELEKSNKRNRILRSCANAETGNEEASESLFHRTFLQPRERRVPSIEPCTSAMLHIWWCWLCILLVWYTVECVSPGIWTTNRCQCPTKTLCFFFVEKHSTLLINE